MIFLGQLNDWKEFRSRQQRDRMTYRGPGWFLKSQEFQQERKRKYGLNDYIQLREKLADQSPLEDWMNYQNYKFIKYERMEESPKEFQKELASNRKMLAEDNYSAFEEIERLEFRRFIGIIEDWGNKVEETKKKQELAERKLKVAKTKWEASQSEELGDTVERSRWIGWLEKKVVSRRTKMDELNRSADEAKRDMEPYEQWLNARRREFDARYSESCWTVERQRLFELEVARTVEYRAKAQKCNELKERALEAGLTYYGDCGAQGEVEIAEEALEAARTEELAPIVGRAALIRRPEKEMRFAEFNVEEEKESTRVLDLK